MHHLSPSARIRALAATLARTLRRVVGAPDYDAYLDYARRHDPGLDPLSREAFARDALARRYDRPGSRCC